MCNSIFLDKDTLPKAKDGETFEVKVKGMYFTDEDGVRKLDIEEVDGNPVASPDDGESECGCGEDKQDLMDQTADDAMRIFFIKKRKG